jgi:hypothetical protein
VAPFRDPDGALESKLNVNPIAKSRIPFEKRLYNQRDKIERMFCRRRPPLVRNMDHFTFLFFALALSVLRPR